MVSGITIVALIFTLQKNVIFKLKDWKRNCNSTNLFKADIMDWAKRSKKTILYITCMAPKGCELNWST
ncbi:hypothetical protein CXF81_05595 [Glaciecola sp. 33A]|nr:hypothetical protein CXF81_05595 [Glaciecola sp. 33A]